MSRLAPYLPALLSASGACRLASLDFERASELADRAVRMLMMREFPKSMILATREERGHVPGKAIDNSFLPKPVLSFNGSAFGVGGCGVRNVDLIQPVIDFFQFSIPRIGTN